VKVLQIMAAHCATSPRSGTEKAKFWLLILLLFSSTFLFTFTYQKYRFVDLVVFDLDHGASNSREVTIKLHPQDEKKNELLISSLTLLSDQFPGPVIEARSGDALAAVVSNQVDDEGVSFYWHGCICEGQMRWTA
jgi:hypothetical protein